MISQRILLKHTVGHFCVDAVCALIVISATHCFTSALFFFLLYNLLAFGGQPLAGWILDKSPKIKPTHDIIGAFILLLLGFIPSLNLFLRIGLVGVGNCLFHTGAGTIVLTSSRNKMAPLGIFVSSGAVGLLTGSLLASTTTAFFIFPFALALLILWNLNSPYKRPKKAANTKPVVLILLLCTCIAIRSFMGFLPLTDFVKTPLVLWMITLGIFGGKILGGFLCDRWGIQKVIYISTAFVLLLFLFSFHTPYLWAIVQMIVNLSMPITLYLMYKAMPKFPAFSFGLAASCLLVGLGFSLGLRNLHLPPSCFLILFIINSGIILQTERKLK